MNKRQTKMLKQIEQLGFVDSAKLTDEDKSITSFLMKNEFITFKANPGGGPKPIYVITELGKAELYNCKIKNFQIWVPIAISIFAAIGGYRQELFWLAQAIMKLLKLLTENSDT